VFYSALSVIRSVTFRKKKKKKHTTTLFRYVLHNTNSKIPLKYVVIAG